MPDSRESHYLLAGMATTYALLLGRVGVRAALIYPLAKVFPH